MPCFIQNKRWCSLTDAIFMIICRIHARESRDRKRCLKSRAVQMARNVFHPFPSHPSNTFYLKRRKRENPENIFFMIRCKKIGERMFSLIVICGQMDGAVKRWKISFTGKECRCVLIECQLPNFN